MSLASSVLRDFRQVAVVGRGSFAEAALMRHRLTGKHAVLKRISKSTIAGKDDAVAAIKREAQALRRLRHPHVVELLGAFADDRDGGGEALCLLLAYYEAGDLQQRVTRRAQEGRRFDEPTLMRWFRQLGSAVEYVHSKLVLHRDIKPANVFLTGSCARGGASDEAIALGDFGICKHLKSAAEVVTTMVGTPYYVAPEVWGGQGYTSKADMWSVGCVFYECMALTPAFGANVDVQALVSAVTAAQFPVPAYMPVEFPQALGWCRKLLQPEPAKRPSAAMMLGRRAEATFAKRGKASPPPPQQRPALPVKKPPGTAAQGLAAAPQVPGSTSNVQGQGRRTLSGKSSPIGVEASGIAAGHQQAPQKRTTMAARGQPPSGRRTAAAVAAARVGVAEKSTPPRAARRRDFASATPPKAARPRIQPTPTQPRADVGSSTSRAEAGAASFSAAPGTVGSAIRRPPTEQEILRRLMQQRPGCAQAQRRKVPHRRLAQGARNAAGVAFAASPPRSIAPREMQDGASHVPLEREENVGETGQSVTLSALARRRFQVRQ